MCDPILVTLLKMQTHHSQSNRENATPSSGTSPLAFNKEVPPPPPPPRPIGDPLKSNQNGQPLPLIFTFLDYTSYMSQTYSVPSQPTHDHYRLL